MPTQEYLDSVINDMCADLENLDRKLTQRSDNLEATQRILLGNISSTKSLVELNFQEIKKAREDILDNQKAINKNGKILERIGEKIESLDEKVNNFNVRIERVEEKLDQIITKLNE
jgi:predicted RNase H-like nuclease (RuvC/YqgF family)